VTNRHDQRTPRVPSLAGVIGWSAWTGLAALNIVLLYQEGDDTAQGLVAYVLAVLIFGALASRTFEAQAARRKALRARREAVAADRAWRVKNTGVWVRGSSELTVRWDDRTRLYWVRGAGEEIQWPDLGKLAQYLTDLEADGWVFSTDSGTRAIRARLDLSGWQYDPLPRKRWSDG
jgi:hypothetical protein